MINHRFLVWYILGKTIIKQPLGSGLYMFISPIYIYPLVISGSYWKRPSRNREFSHWKKNKQTWWFSMVSCKRLPEGIPYYISYHIHYHPLPMNMRSILLRTSHDFPYESYHWIPIVLRNPWYSKWPSRNSEFPREKIVSFSSSLCQRLPKSTSHKIPLNPIKSHEITIQPPFSHGFPMVFPWFSYGFPMVFLESVWFSHGDDWGWRTWHTSTRSSMGSCLPCAKGSTVPRCRSSTSVPCRRYVWIYMFLYICYIYLYVTYIYIYICICV